MAELSRARQTIALQCGDNASIQRPERAIAPQIARRFAVS